MTHDDAIHLADREPGFVARQTHLRYLPVVALGMAHLFWRVFAINAALLVIAVLTYELSGRTLGYVAIAELGVILGANLLLLRAQLRPLGQLRMEMREVDLLEPGERLPRAAGDVGELVEAFNEMLDRLEGERAETVRRALAAQEEERRRIARELHDEVGQEMTAVLLVLQRIAGRCPEEEQPALREAQEEVRRTLDDVRRIWEELQPGLLEELGLRSALAALASSFSERAGIEINCRFAPDLPLLVDDLQLAIYRTAQECLTNVARHAGASHVEFSLERGPGSVVLTVADDGRGFDARAPLGGYGIRGMRERALMIGATLSVGLSPLAGTQVQLKVPLPEDA